VVVGHERARAGPCAGQAGDRHADDVLTGRHLLALWPGHIDPAAGRPPSAGIEGPGQLFRTTVARKTPHRVGAREVERAGELNLPWILVSAITRLEAGARPAGPGVPAPLAPARLARRGRRPRTPSTSGTSSARHRTLVQQSSHGGQSLATGQRTAKETATKEDECGCEFQTTSRSPTERAEVKFVQDGAASQPRLHLHGGKSIGTDTSAHPGRLSHGHALPVVGGRRRLDRLPEERPSTRGGHAVLASEGSIRHAEVRSATRSS